jgi:hypothetical protein
LNLITASGHVYSFLLTEIAATLVQPDLKLFIEPKEGQPWNRSSATFTQPTPDPTRRRWRPPAADGRTSSQRPAHATEEINQFRSACGKLHFDYELVEPRGAFLFRRSTTTIHSLTSAPPLARSTSSEMRTASPFLVSFQNKNGLHRSEVVDAGYLAVEKKLNFTHERCK